MISLGAIVMYIEGAAGTEKCPEEPRLLSIRPIREPVESFGIRGPSGQEQLYA
jgi:hypothetical protein